MVRRLSSYIHDFLEKRSGLGFKRERKKVSFYMISGKLWILKAQDKTKKLFSVSTWDSLVPDCQESKKC